MILVNDLWSSWSWLGAPQDKNYLFGQEGQALGTTRNLTLPWDNNTQPSGRKDIFTLPWKNKKKLVSSRKKKIWNNFWAENTEKIVIWPRQEKTRLQPWQKKSEKEIPLFQFFMCSFYTCFQKKLMNTILHQFLCFPLEGNFFPPGSPSLRPLIILR